MHRPLRIVSLGLILVIPKLFYELATVRESREGSIARHLDCELATSRSTSPIKLTHVGEPIWGLTVREICPGEAGSRCTKPNRRNQS